MNILMMTNTYKPLVGGLEKSIEIFKTEFQKQGHRVVVVAPEFANMEPEEDVLRIPAVQNFNGSDFSVQLPIPLSLTQALGDFKPDIVHSHHPFLLGDTALRAASKYNVPLVFTHHSLYEENVHYVPGDQEGLKKFVIELSTGYANLADLVVAPSESVMSLVRQRGVTSPIEVVPTGIYTDEFKTGNGKAMRSKLNIPEQAFVLGYIGRVAPEKNLEFVARAAAAFLKKRTNAHFMIAGKGPSEEAISAIFAEQGLSDRLHFAGVVQGKELEDAYHALDVFLFASQSETQGLVLAEAMASFVPVVAVDAPGAREVVIDGVNGRLLPKEDLEHFVTAIESIYTLKDRQPMRQACQETAEKFSVNNSVQKMLGIYRSLLVQGFKRRASDEDSPWNKALRVIHTQWDLVKNLTKATKAMVVTVIERGEKKNEGEPEVLRKSPLKDKDVAVGRFIDEGNPNTHEEGFSDPQLAKQVKEAIEGDEAVAAVTKSISIKVKSGKVILTGIVHSEQDKLLLQTKASALAGPDKVVDQLEVIQEMA